MSRVVAALVAAAVVLVAAAGAAAPPERVLAVEWRDDGTRLRWLSARTLRPSGGPVVDLGGAAARLAAVAPDRGTAALADGEDAQVRLVDLRHPRALGVVRLGEGYVAGAVWPRADRLVALVAGPAPSAVVVDPVERVVVSRRAVAGTVLAAVPARAAVVALVAPTDRIGPLRLVVAPVHGAVRAVHVPIAGGIAMPRRPGAVAREAVPGLAASPDGRRAAVVGRDRVVEVDLRTLRATSTRLAGRTPARRAKAVQGWTRIAVWAGRDTVAVSGSTQSLAGGGFRVVPHGLELVSVRSGARRRLDRAATQVTRAGRTLVGHGGTTVAGFGVDGARRFAVADPDGESGWVGRSGRYLYVGSRRDTRFAVVDVRTGRVVGSARTARTTAVIGP